MAIAKGNTCNKELKPFQIYYRNKRLLRQLKKVNWAGGIAENVRKLVPKLVVNYIVAWPNLILPHTLSFAGL
jgi:hypothetical protein